MYYGPALTPDDLDAAARLERMSRTGHGNFSNVNTDGKVPLEKIIAFRDGEPWVIKRFLVSNLSTAPCDDGTVDVDSDSDGLCDKDELAYNERFTKDALLKDRMGGKKFHPQKRNSFANVYNDYINYRRVLYGEGLDLDCTDTNDEDHDILNTCEELYARANSPSGPTTVWTNRMGVSADKKNFDSDGDGFIDYIEMVFLRSKAAALDYNSSTTQIEGYRLDEILSQHRNPARPGQASPYEIEFHSEYVNAKGQNCYTYDQKSLPLVNTLSLAAADAKGAEKLAHKAGENVILVYYIQAPESEPNGTGKLYSTYVKVPFGSTDKLDVGNLPYEEYDPKDARVHIPQ